MIPQNTTTTKTNDLIGWIGVLILKQQSVTWVNHIMLHVSHYHWRADVCLISQYFAGYKKPHWRACWCPSLQIQTSSSLKYWCSDVFIVTCVLLWEKATLEICNSIQIWVSVSAQLLWSVRIHTGVKLLTHTPPFHVDETQTGGKKPWWKEIHVMQFSTSSRNTRLT